MTGRSRTLLRDLNETLVEMEGAAACAREPIGCGIDSGADIWLETPVDVGGAEASGTGPTEGGDGCLDASAERGTADAVRVVAAVKQCVRSVRVASSDAACSTTARACSIVTSRYRDVSMCGWTLSARWRCSSCRGGYEGCRRTVMRICFAT